MSTPEFPDQQTAGTPTPLAEWGDRVIAALIDAALVFAGWILLFIVTAILGALSDTLSAIVSFFGIVILIFVGLYFGYMEGQVGQSPGKKLTGLKVVKMDGGLLGGGMGIVRKIVHFVDGICFIGYLLPLVDSRKQTFADKIINTVVLRDQEKQRFGPQILSA